MKIYGIYKISNLINNKCYIGLSNNIQKRFGEHKRKLRLNSHSNPYLQNSYNLDKNCLTFEIVHQCSEEDLPMYEIYFIKKFKAFYKDGGYNMTIGGESLGNVNKGCIPWNKGKKSLMPAWNKGLKQPNPYGNYNEKRIKQFDKSSNFIKEWNSITNASKELKITRNGINNCLNSKSKTSGNFIWQYV